MMGLFKSDLASSIGLIRISDDIIQQIRLRVQARIAILKIIAKSRSGAETEIEQAARFEIVAAWRDAHPGRNYQVRKNWPLADAMLTDDGECMIRIWLGHDFDDGRNGVEPIAVRVNWKPGGVKHDQKSKVK